MRSKEYSNSLNLFRITIFFNHFSHLKCPQKISEVCGDELRVSTKWLNLLRMKRNEFCAIFFCAICAKPEIFLRKLRMKQNFSFAQNRKFYAKYNFLGKLSRIDILSLELNNWRFIPFIKKILTYEYDNELYYNQLVTSSYKKFKLRDQN